jgi:NADH-quinone oxidoreductase subunit N
MYFDDPAPAFAPSRSMMEGVLIGIAALFISPLSYLAIPLLTTTTMAAAKSLF